MIARDKGTSLEKDQMPHLPRRRCNYDHKQILTINQIVRPAIALLGHSRDISKLHAHKEPSRSRITQPRTQESIERLRTVCNWLDANIQDELPSTHVQRIQSCPESPSSSPHSPFALETHHLPPDYRQAIARPLACPYNPPNFVQWPALQKNLPLMQKPRRYMSSSTTCKAMQRIIAIYKQTLQNQAKVSASQTSTMVRAV